MVAVLSAVAMSKDTPPAGAGVERLTVNVKIVVPELPSFCETSFMESVGFTERSDVPGCVPARARIVVSPEASAAAVVVDPVVGAKVVLLVSLESQTKLIF